MRLSIKEISRILDLPEIDNDNLCLRAITDSRDCKAGDLFICIKGEKADGHDYALQAVKNGAVAILAERSLSGVNVPVFQVENSITALGKLARAWRGKFGGKVIGLTGTAGKTTLKDALTLILSENGKTASTEKNHNNQLGVALTILGTEGDEKFWVIEAGISHGWDMDELGAMINPDLAIILNIGQGHVEGLGDRGVAWHKARFLKWLRPDGHALVNRAYPDLAHDASQYERQIFFFNPSKGNEDAYKLIQEKQPGVYELLLDGQKETFTTPFSGKWGAEICLACAASTKLLNLPVNAAARSLAKARMPKGRMNIINGENYLIYDDTYNANPLSMSQMLETVSAKAKMENRPWFAILGEMGELGAFSAQAHHELGKKIAECGPQFVIWKGDFGEAVFHGLKSGAERGETPFYPVNCDETFKNKIRQMLAKGLLPGNALVLFKGSRMNRLENWLRIFMDILEIPEN